MDKVEGSGSEVWLQLFHVSWRLSMWLCKYILISQVGIVASRPFTGDSAALLHEILKNVIKCQKKYAFLDVAFKHSVKQLHIAIPSACDSQ